jgi:hypothetical protein
MKLSKAKEVIGRLDAASDSRLQTYVNTLSKDRDAHLFDKQVLATLLKYEKSGSDVLSVVKYLKGLDYTSSKYRYDLIHEQAERFTGCDVPNFSWNKNFIKAKQEIMAEVHSWRLKMLQYRTKVDIEDAIPKKSTHAGFSYITTGKRKKGEYIEGLLSSYLSAETLSRAEGSFNRLVLIGSRTQASGAFKSDGSFTHTFKDKSRLVSMKDIYEILAESRWAKPFQNRLAGTSWYAGGKDDSRILGWLSRWRRNYKYSLTVDYSHYDQSLSAWLIRESFDVVKEAFFGREFDDELFSIVREDFINKVFVDGNGSLVESHKGVPSGSMFTQIIDSIANRLMILTYLNARGVSDREMMIMGDDNIIYTHQPLDEKDLSGYLLKNFGIEANSDKCSHMDREDGFPEFLSRIWTIDGVYREPNSLISKMLYPERYRDYENGLKPEAIVQAYILSFPLGMREIIDINKFEADYNAKGGNCGDSGVWMTGLMLYRQRFQNI